MTQVFGNRIVVQEIKEEEEKKTSLGIIVASSSKNPGICKGEIVLVGPEVTYPIQVGDVVYYSPYSGDVTQENPLQKILFETDLYGKE